MAVAVAVISGGIEPGRARTSAGGGGPRGVVDEVIIGVSERIHAFNFRGPGPGSN